MYTIITELLRPTEKLPWRISATANTGRNIYDIPDSCNDYHAFAALQCMKDNNWFNYEMICGHLKDGQRVWVFNSPYSPKVKLTETITQPKRFNK